MGVIDYLVSSYALGRLKSLWGDSREEEADRTSQHRFLNMRWACCVVHKTKRHKNAGRFFFLFCMDDVL